MRTTTFGSLPKSKVSTTIKHRGQYAVSAAIPVILLLLCQSSPTFANDQEQTTAGTDTQNAEKAVPGKDHFVRGLELSNQKDYEGAIREYTEAIRLNPSYGEAYGNRGAARFNVKDYRGALSDYDEALKMFPDNQALHTCKEQAETALQEQANAANNAARANQIRMQAILGGDLADPSTQIMMNAQQRGLIPAGGDPSDPATILMENARRRGLIPQNTNP